MGESISYGGKGLNEAVVHSVASLYRRRRKAEAFGRNEWA